MVRRTILAILVGRPSRHVATPAKVVFIGLPAVSTTNFPKDVAKADWLARLIPLIDDVQRWARELGWDTQRIDKRMEDSEIGPYDAPALRLQRDFTRVLLEPIARSAPGAEGVVDLYLTPAYDDVASLYHYDGAWHLHHRDARSPSVATIREDRSRPLTKETLREALEELGQHAA